MEWWGEKRREPAKKKVLERTQKIFARIDNNSLLLAVENGGAKFVGIIDLREYLIRDIIRS